RRRARRTRHRTTPEMGRFSGPKRGRFSSKGRTACGGRARTHARLPQGGPMHLRARAVLVCLVVPAAAAVGQLVTQPPEHAPRPEEHIAIATTPHGWRPTGEPPRQANQQFKSLVQRDAAGNVVPLREPIEWAALRNNPLVTP